MSRYLASLWSGRNILYICTYLDWKFCFQGSIDVGIDVGSGVRAFLYGSRETANQRLRPAARVLVDTSPFSLPYLTIREIREDYIRLAQPECKHLAVRVTDI